MEQLKNWVGIYFLGLTYFACWETQAVSLYFVEHLNGLKVFMLLLSN